MNEPMPLNDSELDALFARARARRPDTARAEYAFETRLLARLRQARSTLHSPWAAASWRFIPFLALFVAGLILWQDQTATAAQDAEQVSYVENPDAVDLCNNFN